MSRHHHLVDSRALTIPARYATVYAYQLQPQDFHACFEVSIGGNWYIFDATHLAPLNGLVRISVGRDASDAAVASLFGDIGLPDLDLRQTRYRAIKDNIFKLGQQTVADPDFLSGNSPETTLASSIGVLYVTEGSVHGGRQILRSLGKNISDLRPTEISFVKGFGSETGSIWKRFCIWMNSFELNIPEQAQACEAAEKTFGVFKNHLLGPTSEI